LHPFDIKAALFAKHAQHVVLIHFPIAPYTTIRWMNIKRKDLEIGTSQMIDSKEHVS
jgi:hypothetical protein